MYARTRYGWGSGNAALAALGLNVLVLGALTLVTAVIDLAPEQVAVGLVELSQMLVRLSTFGIWIGALGFLPWLHRTYARAREVASTPELEDHWRTGPVVCFFIPIRNLVRPYGTVRALDEALDPDRVPLPELRMADASATYREPAPVVVPDLRRAPSAPVGLWWTLWIGRLASSTVLAFSHTQSNLWIAIHDAVVCAAAVAAWIVVRRIAARLDEVERRRAWLEDPAVASSGAGTVAA